jgi:hypothetical protein
MPHNGKPELYALRKALSEPLTQTYMQYTKEALRSELLAAGVDIERSLQNLAGPELESTPEPQAKLEETTVVVDPPRFEAPEPTPREADPEEMPSQRLNTQPEDVPIRTDEQGRVWYQEEVRKPAYPKPRGRRVLTYVETGTEKETIQSGEYIETFEVAGRGAGKPSEVKITLPSYQVGIYKHPRFPFKIHCYNDREGFDLEEVEDYWGGAQLVPGTVKRIYIENDLCYDIRSVVLTIQAEYRQLQLQARKA